MRVVRTRAETPSVTSFYLMEEGEAAVHSVGQKLPKGCTSRQPASRKPSGRDVRTASGPWVTPPRQAGRQQ
ncbi:hypothetical protein GCM10018793_31580 [Streptomyces sulfonofaciens]|uniref:Uncharacterized protein n=1 Tax=Streptomyces sulfonofaciens TaxID=68272 RepID=A0A919G7G6_9ACTN|nr:hypothetical protein GCM10018793_31580 [Streptomyces sulfonofaciens]